MENETVIMTNFGKLKLKATATGRKGPARQVNENEKEER
jgi:hypothetical protein